MFGYWKKDDGGVGDNWPCKRSSCQQHLHRPSSNKIQNGDILVSAYPGLFWKMAVKQVLLLPNEVVGWAWLTSVTLTVAGRPSAYKSASCRRLMSPTFLESAKICRRHYFVFVCVCVCVLF